MYQLFARIGYESARIDLNTQYLTPESDMGRSASVNSSVGYLSVTAELATGVSCWPYLVREEAETLPVASTPTLG